MPKCSVRPYWSPGNSLVGVLGRDERRLALHRGVVALGQVGRAAPQLGQHRRERVEHLAGGLAGGHALGVGREARQRVGPAVRQRAGRPAGRAAPCAPALASRPGVEALLPLGVQPRGRARSTFRACASTSSSTSKVCVRVEAEDSLGRRHLVGAQRRAVDLPVFCLFGAGQPMIVRSRMNDGRPVSALRRLQRRRRAPATSSTYVAVRRRAPVDGLHVPAVRLVAGGDVLADRRCRCRPRWRSGCRRRSA